jgi:hypothetical protein
MIRAFGGDNGKSRFEFRGHEAPMDIDPRPADTPLQRSSSDPFVSPFAFNSQQPMGIINNEMEIDDAIESTTAVNNDENDQLQNNTHSTNEQLIQSEKQPSFVVNINSKRSKRAASSGGSGLWQTIRQLDLRTWMHLPAVIYQWAHLLYNILVLSFIAYLFVQTIRTLYADYQLKFQYFQQGIYSMSYSFKR